jgi:hypothetical protein
MTKYAVLMYADPAHTRAMSRQALDVVARKHAAIRDDLTRSGELLNGAGLVLPDETLILRPGAVEKGPLVADRAEHLTAYYIIECATAQRAQTIADRMLDDHVTAVELRRIHDSVGLSPRG